MLGKTSTCYKLSLLGIPRNHFLNLSLLGGSLLDKPRGEFLPTYETCSGESFLKIPVSDPGDQ